MARPKPKHDDAADPGPGGKGRRAPLTGGHWVTIKHEDGSWRHLYLQGRPGHESKAQRAANDRAIHGGAGAGAAGAAAVAAHRGKTSGAPRQSPQQRDHAAKLDFLSGGQVTGRHKAAPKAAPKAKTLREHAAEHKAAKAQGRGTPERAEQAAGLRVHRTEKAARLDQARGYQARVQRAKAVMEARQSRAEEAVRKAGAPGGADGAYARLYADRHDKGVARDRAAARRAQSVYHANVRRRDETLHGQRGVKGATQPPAAAPPPQPAPTPAPPAPRPRPVRTPRRVEATKGTFETLWSSGDTKEMRPVQGHRVGTVGVTKSPGGRSFQVIDATSGNRIADAGKHKQALRAAAILDRFKVTQGNMDQPTRSSVLAERAGKRVVGALDRMQFGPGGRSRSLPGGQKVSEIAASRAKPTPAPAAPSLREQAAAKRAPKTDAQKKAQADRIYARAGGRLEKLHKVKGELFKAKVRAETDPDFKGVHPDLMRGAVKQIQGVHAAAQAKMARLEQHQDRAHRAQVALRHAAPPKADRVAALKERTLARIESAKATKSMPAPLRSTIAANYREARGAKAAPAPGAPAAAHDTHAKLHEAFRGSKGSDAGTNLVRLDHLRERMGGTREQQDAAIRANIGPGKPYSLESHEGLLRAPDASLKGAYIEGARRANSDLGPEKLYYITRRPEVPLPAAPAPSLRDLVRQSAPGATKAKSRAEGEKIVAARKALADHREKAAAETKPKPASDARARAMAKQAEGKARSDTQRGELIAAMKGEGRVSPTLREQARAHAAEAAPAGPKPAPQSPPGPHKPITAADLKPHLEKLHNGEIDDRGTAIDVLAKRMGVPEEHLMAKLSEMAKGPRPVVEFDHIGEDQARISEQYGGKVHRDPATGKPVGQFRVMRPKLFHEAAASGR